MHEHLPTRVMIGGRTKAELCGDLARSGVRLNQLGEQLFADDAFTTEPSPRFVRVRATRVADLGHPRGATWAHIMASAQRSRLGAAPLELAPHLRLQYRQQPEGLVGSSHRGQCAPPGSITVVSEPLCADDDRPKGFYLRTIEDELWLRGYRSWAGHVWSPEDVLLFSEVV